MRSRHLQLMALTLTCTLVVSMCLLTRRPPAPQPMRDPIPLDVRQQLRDFANRENPAEFHLRDLPAESTPARDLPPAVEQLRHLEQHLRSMLLY